MCTPAEWKPPLATCLKQQQFNSICFALKWKCRKCDVSANNPGWPACI
jgi:hypothetical protein